MQIDIDANGQQSLLQVSTKSQNAHIKQGDSSDLVQTTRSLSFYMPYGSRKCEDAGFPKNKIVAPGSGPVENFRNWLWLVDEGTRDASHHYDNYVQHRLACSNSLVNSVEEADLCYPTCENMHKSKPSHSLLADHIQRVEAHESNNENLERLGEMQQHCVEVPLQQRDSWSGCSSICFGPEASKARALNAVPGKCFVEVPYLHGIMWPSQDNVIPPWEFSWNRTTMLTFVGGEHRGLNWKSERDVTLGTMVLEAAKINAVSPQTVFFPHVIQEPGRPNSTDEKEILEAKNNENKWYAFGQTSDFYLDTWGAYASANFSWQPKGDTPTRRAVYDSLMFGCIPVIDTRAAPFYRGLFNGHLWKDVPLEDVFVVIPQGKEYDGPAILQMLKSMPDDEVIQRRSNLKKIAPSLQWGQHTPNGGDAFQTALRSFRTGPALDPWL